MDRYSGLCDRGRLGNTGYRRLTTSTGITVAGDAFMSLNELPKSSAVVIGKHVSLLQCILQAQQLNYDVVENIDLLDQVAFIWLWQEGFATNGYGFNWLTRSGMDWLAREEQEAEDES